MHSYIRFESVCFFGIRIKISYETISWAAVAVSLALQALGCVFACCMHSLRVEDLFERVGEYADGVVGLYVAG
jgi:hypothetical protein